MDVVHQIQPDIVLLDVQLADSDGRDICKELKEKPVTQAIPVIIISASHGWQELNKTL